MRVPVYAATVRRARSLTPRMRRVTLGGQGLTGFTSRGLPDERVKLLLPQAGQERPVLPEINEDGYHYPPGARRPISRTFTVRRFDPEGLELEIDIARHDGSAAVWSVRARVGEVVGIAGPTGGYEPAANGGLHLIAGDEAALPAIATLLERLPAGARARVLVEVADASARLALDSRADAEVRWLDRGHAPGAPPGAVLVHAVRELPWPGEPVQVWAAGEALAMRAIRRFLRDDVGLPRERYQVVGYWRDELSEDQAIEAHLAAQEAARVAGRSEAEIEDAGLY
jgi:NADPH-dependent ferric siderophore reductase